jgi:predicted metalloprotease with PDZ domain
VIRLEMDATDIDRRIVSVKQTIPVTGPGPLILLYPQWIPGNHGPVGPVDDIGDLHITAGGQELRWVRNTANTNAYEVEVPAGVSSVDVAFKWLTPIDGSQGRIVFTDEMLNIQWEKAVLYPAGYYSRQITVEPTLRLPAGWQYGTALDTRAFQNGVATFAPITLEHFADSPVFAGAHYRQIDLDPGGRSPVRLNIVADDADILIREQTNGRKSLDDFARAFFGVQDGSWDPAPYTFADVTSTLNGVQPNDWAAFLRTRLDAVGVNAPTPLGGIQRGGYRLVWRETPNDYSKALNKELERVDFQYSLGLSLNNANRVTAVRWGSPAFNAGLTSGWEVVAVNGRAASAAAISEAVTASKGNTTPIEMMLKKGDRFRTIAFDYHDGLRYPHLERIPGTPDRLGDILAPRRR